MQPPVAVAHAQQMFVPAIHAQITSTVIELHGHVLLVRALGRQRHNGARHLARISAGRRHVQQRLGWMCSDHAPRQAQSHLAFHLQLQPLPFRGRLHDPQRTGP